MSEKTAQNDLKNNLDGPEASLRWKRTAWTSIPRDDVYEQRIFDLECYIQQLETCLMIAESEKNQKKQKHTA